MKELQTRVVKAMDSISGNATSSARQVSGLIILMAIIVLFCNVAKFQGF